MHKASVLVIEDAAAIAHHIAGVLECFEYRVIGPAATGERAIELAHQDRPDLALVDIRLAGHLDGIETAKQLRQLFDLPVVFLTAHSDEQTLKRASSARPSSFILKPFDERDLATQLDMALLKHQSEHTLDASESPQENNRQDDHDRLFAVLEHLPVGVWMTDHEGRLLRKNAAADRLWSDEAPLPACNAVSGQPIAAHEYPVARALATGEPVEPVELSIRESDGKPRTVLVAAVPLRDREGRISGAIGINFDITERKLAENLVHESEERLAVFAKELEDLVSERTHELLESQEQLRTLAARLNWAEQRERKRLATELHDYLAQMLVLARLKLTQAKQGSVTRAAELTRETDAIIGDCLAYTRTLMADLNPPVLREGGLAAGLL